MKNTLRFASAALLLSFASVALAGPGPQYWAHIGETNSRSQEVKAVNTTHTSDKRLKAVKTARQNTKAESSKAK